MLDRGYARLAAWLAATSILIATLYSSQLFVLTSGLDQLLSETLGTVFPAYPFLALLVLLTAIRWKDFHAILLTERGFTSDARVRLVGILLVALPVILWTLFFDQATQSVYLAMEVSACSLVLVAYGALISINPKIWRTMLPYASLYAVGLVAPLFMIDALGGAMAAFSSYIASAIASALGVHVAWQGVSFAFVSTGGQPISAVVTPACSAAYSISIYLALLGLTYLDMGGSLSTTAKFAIVGVAIIPVLDSVRIATMIWFGFVGGAADFWAIHDWLGYAMFFAFYIAVLALYSRTVGRGPPHSPVSAVVRGP